MRRRMIIDDDNFRFAFLQRGRLAQLADELRGVAPVAIVDDDDGEAWNGDARAAARREPRRAQREWQAGNVRLHAGPFRGARIDRPRKRRKYSRSAKRKTMP